MHHFFRIHDPDAINVKGMKKIPYQWETFTINKALEGLQRPWIRLVWILRKGQRKPRIE